MEAVNFFYTFKGLASKKKDFFRSSKKIQKKPQKMWPLSSRKGGGGWEALVDGPLKKELYFFAVPLVKIKARGVNLSKKISVGK